MIRLHGGQLERSMAELIMRHESELAKLKAERDELRNALEALMLVAEHIDISQGLTMYQLFPKRFDKAKAVLAKGKP